MQLKNDTRHLPKSGKYKEIAEIIEKGRVLVVSGAGISTDSGIPDYRGPDRKMRSRAPIQHRDFLELEEARRSYWARSSLGWPMVRDAKPNAGHRAVAQLERMDSAVGVITQNVDGLHQAAGSCDGEATVKIDGAIDKVLPEVFRGLSFPFVR